MNEDRFNLGFSLLEVMVVVFMMALISTVAVLKLGLGQNVLIESEARQFADKLELLMDESILSAGTYRILIDTEKHGYEFQKFTDKWEGITQKPFNKHLLSDDMAIKVTIIVANTGDNQSNELASSNPDNIIFIDADGVTSEFELLFGDRSKKGGIEAEKNYWLVKGGHSVLVSNTIE